MLNISIRLFIVNLFYIQLAEINNSDNHKPD